LYLTFDDGPVPGPTEFVLEILNRVGVKATFFCIGDNIRKHPEIFRNVLGHGHATGNHTHHHLNGWKTTTNDYYKNVTRCREEIEAYLSHKHLPQGPDNYGDLLFRPPFGRVSRNQIKKLQPEYKIIMWDVLSIDYNKNLSGEKCLRNTISASRPGSIVVFHDSYKAEKNLMYALPRFVEHFLEMGFDFRVIQG